MQAGFVQARRRNESMRASTIDDNAAWADSGASVIPFIFVGILRLKN